MLRILKKITNNFKNMKITLDKKSEAIYIYFLSENESKHFPLRSVTVDENITIDYSKENKLFGIEILSLNLFDIEELKKIEFKEL